MWNLFKKGTVSRAKYCLLSSGPSFGFTLPSLIFSNSLYSTFVLTQGRKRKQRFYSLFAPLPQHCSNVLSVPLIDLKKIFVHATWTQLHKLENHPHHLEIIWITFLISLIIYTTVFYIGSLGLSKAVYFILF